MELGASFPGDAAVAGPKGPEPIRAKTREVISDKG
jgi:hypothetical protein